VLCTLRLTTFVLNEYYYYCCPSCWRWVSVDVRRCCTLQLALSAASPIYRGFLADTDCRWNVISASVDDRTREERGIDVSWPCINTCLTCMSSSLSRCCCLIFTESLFHHESGGGWIKGEARPLVESVLWFFFSALLGRIQPVKVCYLSPKNSVDRDRVCEWVFFCTGSPRSSWIEGPLDGCCCCYNIECRHMR